MSEWVQIVNNYVARGESSLICSDLGHVSFETIGLFFFNFYNRDFFNISGRWTMWIEKNLG